MITIKGVAMECSEIPQIPLESLGAPDNFNGHLSSWDTTKYCRFQPASMSREELEVNGRDDRLAQQPGGMPLLLWLHGVTSDHNVAAICRTALYFGVNSVIFSSRETGSPNSFTSRAGVGAAEFLQLFKVENPIEFMKKSRQRGDWHFIAACAPFKDATPIERLDQRFIDRPSVLMLGGEDNGLPKHLMREANEKVSIRTKQDRRLFMQSGLDSLNVSVAAGILCERLRTYDGSNH
ncbi:MAG: hypothetical protein M1831_004012 [Alyxoria varia]|nr:MAG: hypothetical protein M1831_004012 [Alyxoria varia]